MSSLRIALSEADPDESHASRANRAPRTITTAGALWELHSACALSAHCAV